MVEKWLLASMDLHPPTPTPTPPTPPHPLDKMATISQKIFSGAFSWMKKKYILVKISLKFIHEGPIDNNPVFV